MKFLLDAGHGGDDPGAVNQDTGRQEKDINLEVVLALGVMLRDAGHNVLYTRDRDVALFPALRLKMIERYKPDAFISVHCNSSTNPQAHGIEVVYRDEYDLPIAKAIQASLVAALGLKDRGIKTDIGDLKRRLAVLGDLETPAILIEIGFLSNEGDLEVIEDEKLIANAILEGIENWA